MLTEPGRPAGREHILAEKQSPSDRRRQRGNGGVKSVRDADFLVDIEISRDPITGQRLRISRQIHGSREDAEVALAKLKVADGDGRVPRSGTKARIARATTTPTALASAPTVDNCDVPAIGSSWGLVQPMND
jgi:hypothetical protein